MNSKSTQTTTATATPVKKHNETVPIAGGVLALLAIGGAAAAMTRRREDDEEELADENSMEYEPEAAVDEPDHAPVIHKEQPAIVAPSAFAWNGQGTGTSEPMVEEERQNGESWIERAYRGPSPSNPSASLKNRLRRAAFFDKRERDAAAGLAEPVDPSAGLPQAMIDEREHEVA